ncbi:unnamed protein product [Acanthoscelides obtectus]|uniref:Uncharacterized protein n=1 Tax=Acanthoscelides obtectus TaxID=200917 RepID=A0A9P0P5C0_ACAOB|nr:unnamed protein product [Acanthoscelides obtectus]CAK1666549.1 hypothetical protein AOBTE_LOCUS25366 [Acanthoscelides obtectus]
MPRPSGKLNHIERNPQYRSLAQSVNPADIRTPQVDLLQHTNDPLQTNGTTALSVLLQIALATCKEALATPPPGMTYCSGGDKMNSRNNRKKWDKKSMLVAVNAVTNNKMAYLKASKLFNSHIPRQREATPPPSTENDNTPHPGQITPSHRVYISPENIIPLPSVSGVCKTVSNNKPRTGQQN